MGRSFGSTGSYVLGKSWASPSELQANECIRTSYSSIVSLVGVGLSTVSAPLMYLGPTLHESQASFANSNASVPGLVSG